MAIARSLGRNFPRGLHPLGFILDPEGARRDGGLQCSLV